MRSSVPGEWGLIGEIFYDMTCFSTYIKMPSQPPAPIASYSTEQIHSRRITASLAGGRGTIRLENESYSFLQLASFLVDRVLSLQVSWNGVLRVNIKNSTKNSTALHCKTALYKSLENGSPGVLQFWENLELFGLCKVLSRKSEIDGRA